MKTVSDLTFKHPEIQSGEIFYCNMDEGNFRKLNWQTKRWGNRAYTYEGNSISSSSPKRKVWGRFRKIIATF